ncbi:hypothetical protein D3C83_83210 [compost metagenome]
MRPTPGEGSTFSVFLPALPVSGKIDATPAPAPVATNDPDITGEHEQADLTPPPPLTAETA